MACKVSAINLLCTFFLLVLGCFCLSSSEAQKVPAMYVLGDSLVDVGTNNYLALSLAKANFPHNGVDYHEGKATGRFNNGKNTADLLAEKVGLPTSPAYLSLVTLPKRIKNEESFPLTGVSFASGGAGIFNTTNQLFGTSVSLETQIKQFAKVYEDLVKRLGSVSAQDHISKSLFTIVIGNNDLIVYFSPGTDLATKSTPQQYIDSMVLNLNRYLKKVYSFGARKFVITDVGSIGCSPAFRNRNKPAQNDCNDEANHWTVQYNENLKSMLHDLKNLELKDMAYTYADVYGVFTGFLENPDFYGFNEVKAACCGRGNLRAEVPCLPVSDLCPNRVDHVFWDLYHPTQAAAQFFVNIVYNSTSSYATPMNIEQLVSM